jgi:hypothetical protein
MRVLMTENERQRWTATSDAALMREYLDMQRACLGVFAMAARRYQDEIAGMLLARGITEIPNMLGAISVRPWLPNT